MKSLHSSLAAGNDAASRRTSQRVKIQAKPTNVTSDGEEETSEEESTEEETNTEEDVEEEAEEEEEQQATKTPVGRSGRGATNKRDPQSQKRGGAKEKPTAVAPRSARATRRR